MTRKLIPKREEIYCDRCGCHCDPYKNYKEQGYLGFKCRELDVYQNWMMINHNIDLCDDCLHFFNLFMDEVNKDNVK